MPFAKNTTHNVVHLVRVSGIYHALLSISSTDRRNHKLADTNTNTEGRKSSLSCKNHIIKWE